MSAEAHAEEPVEPVLPVGVRLFDEEEEENPAYDTDEDDIDEDASAWKEVILKSVSQIKIEDDPLEQKLLGQAEKEWDDIFEHLKKVARPLGYKTINDGNIDEVLIHVLTNDYVGMLLKHTNFVQQDEESTVPLSDVLDFLCMEIVCAYLCASPTQVYQDVAFKEFAGVCDESTYFRVYQSLGKDAEEREPYKVSPTIVEIEKIVSQSCRWAYSKSAVIALDDDKPPISGIGASKQGIAARKIKKNFHPVVHMCVSVLTSVFLSAHLELYGDRVQNCIDSLLMHMTGTQNPERIVLENLFPKDRGYNTKNNSRACRKRGMDEIGSRRRERNFKYTYGDPDAASHGQRDIPLTGADGS